VSERKDKMNKTMGGSFGVFVLRSKTNHRTTYEGSFLHSFRELEEVSMATLGIPVHVILMEVTSVT
jgi:hypothetical protein